MKRVVFALAALLAGADLSASRAADTSAQAAKAVAEDSAAKKEGASQSAAKPGPVTADKAGIQWVRIPGGGFMMGTGDLSETKPVHQVTVKSFQLAKTLVTFGQYNKCVEAGACAPAHVSDGTCFIYDGSIWKQGNLPASFQGVDQPAVCIDWEQAKAFSAWIGGRLPSEAEWEYAARSAGKDWKYPWGNEEATCERAVIDNEGGMDCGREATWPVCSKPKGNSKQGLCDMAGNAWEWVQDWYHGSYDGAPADGSAWEDTGSSRVGRGGSWYSVVGLARSADRYGGDPGMRGCRLGFRPAR
jgi:formylglycine-generating enzyme required for sulfatase activity